MWGPLYIYQGEARFYGLPEQREYWPLHNERKPIRYVHGRGREPGSDSAPFASMARECDDRTYRCTGGWEDSDDAGNEFRALG